MQQGAGKGKKAAVENDDQGFGVGDLSLDKRERGSKEPILSIEEREGEENGDGVYV